MELIQWLVIGVLCSQALAIIPDRQPCSNDEQFNCGADGEKCRRKKCVCQRVGMANLGCFEKNTYKFCSLANDPKGLNFASKPGKAVDLPLPCQYLAAEWTVPGNNPCNVKVFTAETRFEGKFFISTFKASLTYGKNGKHKLDLTVKGKGKDGKYKFDLHACTHDPDRTQTDQSAIDLSDYHLGGKDESKQPVFQVNEDAKRAELVVPKCALKIFFRPMDKTLTVHTVSEIPGLLVGVKDTQNKPIEFNLANGPFCLSPKPGQNAMATHDLGLTDPQHIALYNALLSSTDDQTISSEGQMCKDTAAAVVKCQEIMERDPTILKAAFDSCTQMLHEPLFVNCYASFKSTKGLLRLFKNCLNCYCKGGNQCGKVLDLLKESNCGDIIRDFSLPVE